MKNSCNVCDFQWQNGFKIMSIVNGTYEELPSNELFYSIDCSRFENDFSPGAWNAMLTPSDINFSRPAVK